MRNEINLTIGTIDKILYNDADVMTNVEIEKFRTLRQFWVEFYLELYKDSPVVEDAWVWFRLLTDFWDATLYGDDPIDGAEDILTEVARGGYSKLVEHTKTNYFNDIYTPGQIIQIWEMWEELLSQ